jgi:predicted small lipoprotein YifL
MTRLIVYAVVASIIISCGFKGPLYLPEKMMASTESSNKT